MADNHTGYDKVYEFVLSLSVFHLWNRPTRLTVPILILDEAMIHRLNCAPRPNGQLDIEYGRYPSPELFGSLQDVASLEKWVKQQLKVEPYNLRLVRPIGPPNETGGARPEDNLIVVQDRSNRALQGLYRTIYDLAFSIVPDEGEAHEIAIAALHTYFRRGHSLTLIDAVPVATGYTRRIAVRYLVDHYSDDQLEIEVAPLVHLASAFEPRPGVSTTASEVATVVRRLPTEDQFLIVMYYCKRLPLADLALLLGRSELETRGNVHQALRRFARVYGRPLTSAPHLIQNANRSPASQRDVDGTTITKVKNGRSGAAADEDTGHHTNGGTASGAF